MLHAVYLTLVKKLRMSSKLKIPLLLILAVVIILIMLRLAVWQLDRAEQKQQTLDQVRQQAQLPSGRLLTLLKESDINDLKYRRVSISGKYVHEKSIYVDNQVVAGQVGYRVFTPFMLDDGQFVMINRGWVSVGSSRASLPEFTTPDTHQVLHGRLNSAPAQPPLWNDDYPVAQGSVWAYLPLDEYASQMQLTLLPLVVELAPRQAGDAEALEAGELVSSRDDAQFIIAWQNIDDEWVAKHQGYAFQWLMMAVAFFIACLVLLVRFSMKK